MEKSTSQLDPMVVLRDTVSRFRRKANECQFAINNIGMHDPYPWTIQQAVYDVEADRLDDLISLCDGTATKNASADNYGEEAERVESLIDVCRGESSTTVSRGFDVDDLPVSAAETIDDNADTLPLMPRSGLTPQR
jgi:hypothetical protein